MVRITLKAARVNKDLSIKEAAHLIGVGDKTLWNWENGFTSPKVENIAKICEVYEINYDNLIFLEQQNG